LERFGAMPAPCDFTSPERKIVKPEPALSSPLLMQHRHAEQMAGLPPVPYFQPLEKPERKFPMGGKLCRIISNDWKTETSVYP
jgi:hypothetical protein